MYYVKFYQYNNGEQQEFSQLILGSANASFNGMENNAENLSSYKFNRNNRFYERIDNYFLNLANGKSVKGGRFIWNDGEKYLYLPQIKVSNKTQSFSSWLRSGTLFYQYTNDSNFGVVSIKLKSPQPTAVKWGKSGFGKENLENQRELKKRYLDKKGLVEENSKKERDLTLAGSIETNHGRWVSKEHYNLIKDKLKPTDVLEKSLEDAEKKSKDIAKKFMKGIEQLRIENQDNPDVLLSLRVIDEKYVLNAIREKIKKDKKKCLNKAFCMRYTCGYEPSSVPNFSSVDWVTFVESWFDYCLMKGEKKRGFQNPLAIKVKKLLIDSKKSAEYMKRLFSKIDPESPCSSETIGKWFLNNDWNCIKYKDKKTLKDKICGYYKSLKIFRK